MSALFIESKHPDVAPLVTLIASISKTYTCFSEYVYSRLGNNRNNSRQISDEGTVNSTSEPFVPTNINSQEWSNMHQLSQQSINRLDVLDFMSYVFITMFIFMPKN